MGQLTIPGVGRLPVDVNFDGHDLNIQINTPFGEFPLDRESEQRTNPAGNSSTVTGTDGSPIQTSPQVQSLIQEMELSDVQIAQQGSLSEIKLQSPELGNVSVVLPTIPNMTESDLLAAVLPQIGEIDSQIAGQLDSLALEIQQNGTSLNMRAVAIRDGRQVEQVVQGVPISQLQQGSQQLASSLNQALQSPSEASQATANTPAPTSSPATDPRVTEAVDRLRAMGFVDVEQTFSRSEFSTSPEGIGGVAGRLVLTDGREIPFSFEVGSLPDGWTPEAAEAIVSVEIGRILQRAESVPNLSAQVLSIRRQISGGMTIQLQTGEQRLVTAPINGLEEVQAAVQTAVQNSSLTARNPSDQQPPVAPPAPRTTQDPTSTTERQPHVDASSATPIPVVPPQLTPARPDATTPQTSGGEPAADGATVSPGNTTSLGNLTPIPTESVGAQLTATQRAQALRALVEASQLRDDSRKGQITLTRDNGQGGENLLSFFRQQDGTVLVVYINDQGSQRMYGDDPVVMATYDPNGNLIRGEAIPQLDAYLGSFVVFPENAPARLSLSEGSHLRSVMSSNFYV